MGVRDDDKEFIAYKKIYLKVREIHIVTYFVYLQVREIHIVMYLFASA